MFISTGEERWARTFAEDRGITGPVLIDTERAAYRAVSLKRTPGATFSMQAMKAGRRALKAGFRQGRTQGDPWQQGGVFVVMPDGRVPFAYTSAFAGDHPDEQAVVRAVRDAVGGALEETPQGTLRR